MANLSSTTTGMARNFTTPEDFAAYTAERITAVNRVLPSAAVTSVSIPNQGEIHNRPYVQPLSGTAALSNATAVARTDLGSVSPDNIRYWVGEYNAAWRENDLVSTETGYNIESFIASQAAPFWSTDINQRLGGMLEGYADSVGFGSDSGDMVNISLNGGNVAAANRFSVGTRFSAAEQVLGDRIGEEGILLVNSTVYAQMLQDDQIAFIPDSQTGSTIASYAGLQVIVDNNVCRTVMGSTNGTFMGADTTTANRAYHASFILNSGSIGYGVGTALRPFETERDVLAAGGGGSSTIVSRVRYGISLNGVDWAGSSAPADLAALRTASNHARKFDTKNVGIVAVISN